MKNNLTNSEKICKNCNESKPINKFASNKKSCNYCYECRQLLYVRCNVCSIIKRRTKIDRINESEIICRKCISNKFEKTDLNFKEAFSIMDKFYNLKGNKNVIHSNKSVLS